MIIRHDYLFKLIAIWSQLTGIRFVSKVSRCLKLIALFNSMKREKKSIQTNVLFVSNALKTSLFIWIEFLLMMVHQFSVSILQFTIEWKTH